MDIIGFDTNLGVVPILVNTGAALLPAAIAGLSSVAALLLKPRVLLSACRRRPQIPILLVVGVVAVWFGGSWLMSGPVQAARKRPVERATSAQPERIDWTDVALKIIRAGGIEKAGLPAFLALPGKASPAAIGQGALFEPEPDPVVRGFRTDAARSGYDGGPVPLDLRPRWRHNEEDCLFLASPTVWGRYVYAASCYLDVKRTYGVIYCLDAETGRVRWSRDELAGEASLKGVFSSPAITADGRYLVVGEGLHFDTGSHLICLETATGRLHWQVETPLHIEGSPAIEGDLVVAGVGAIETVPDRKLVSDPGYVLAVRVSDGKTLWTYPVNDPESSPVLAGGVCYIGSGFHGRALVALRTASDEELKKKGLDRLLWRTPLAHPITGAITVAGDLVLAGGGNGDYVASDPKNPEGIIVALNRADGKIRWQQKLGDAVLGAIAVSGGKAFCAGRTGEVLALDVASGRILWRRRLSGNAPVLAAPAIAGAYVYAVSQDGYLAVLQAEDGKVLEKHYINDAAQPGAMGLSASSPTIARGRVYVGSETGGLQCFTGAKVE